MQLIYIILLSALSKKENMLKEPSHEFCNLFRSLGYHMYCIFNSSCASWARQPYSVQTSAGWFEFRIFFLLDWFSTKDIGPNLS